MVAIPQKVLVVEDEPDIRKLLQYNLAQEHFKVVEAEDGEQALKILKQDKPNLIILDLMLPGLSGLEICRTLREHAETARLPILMLTAKAGEADKVIGLEMGADDYLAKPFSPREMLARDVWGETHRSTPLDNVIDVHMTRLRKKVDAGHAVRLIQTIRGVGFVLREESA